MTLYNVIHPRQVTEFSYRYGDPSFAHIFMSFMCLKEREKELASIFDLLKEHDMIGMDLSQNEMAKSHAR